jgi:hypothetical protein
MKFKLSYDFLRKIIEFITPSTLKKLLLWFFKNLKLVLTVLYNIIVWLCPCIDTITVWASNQFIHFIRYFEKKYNTLPDDNFEEDENDFNWWTKYYGFKYQKVHFSIHIVFYCTLYFLFST